MNNKLKPVIFQGGTKRFYSPNSYAQNILLKAMSKGITDPQELRKIAGLRTVAEVYRTLDKMAIRREYHEALSNNDVSLDYIVGKLKGLADFGDSEKVRLSAVQTLMKSLGLDKYEQSEDAGGNWEDALMKAIQDESKGGTVDPHKVIEAELGDYEIIEPELPEKIKKLQEDEKRAADELYAAN